jgi:phosphatidylserine decarboxylase
MMTLKQALRALGAQEDLNFLLTNRIPRIALTRFMGWFAALRQPWISRPSIAIWQLFSDLDLQEARESRFASLHDAFIRELKPGARVVDARADVFTSPSDAIVGATGVVDNGRLFQAKGFDYQLEELVGSATDALAWQGATYVTLRLTAGMYHRFHAPANAWLRQVRYISGDTWNVNPIALKRVERLFCKNERACLKLYPDAGGPPIGIVAVAAILVASIRLHAVPDTLNTRFKGRRVYECQQAYAKGEEMGWFHHGSTLILLVPPGYERLPDWQEGDRIQMGRALFLRRGLEETVVAGAAL